MVRLKDDGGITAKIIDQLRGPGHANRQQDGDPRKFQSRGCQLQEVMFSGETWFGDPDPRLGTAWEKGERLAKRVAPRRTLLVLDGLEPLQNPPGQQKGRLPEPSLQALLRELAAFNTGLCVITTRTALADIADHERTSAVRGRASVWCSAEIACNS
jgi:hypothetical protein